ncbi:MAG: excinuclease ABC subunit B, partial [Gemmatimonadetes bacterium]|nr:excinuclease ABC subunit B [Gemmatimonadota bacterium]
MNKDISEILDEWEYDPESNVRRIRGKDGVPRIQVRVDQGAFQG